METPLHRNAITRYATSCYSSKLGTDTDTILQQFLIKLKVIFEINCVVIQKVKQIEAFSNN